MSAAASQPIEERVVGRYALHGEIASGGMATVYFGRLLGPAGFSKTVAIKRLHAQLAKDPEFVAMFLDEARLAARIQHPNVVSTLDVVALEGELLLVLEYVHGESLAQLFRRVGKAKVRVPLALVAAIGVGMLHGLHAAHEATDEQGRPLGIVHRDVSPHNVIISVDGLPRVLDFGVAKAAGRLASTRSGEIKGKIAYMSPEQIDGEAVDRRTDVYAASIILWELLAGRRLFEADNEGALVKAVTAGASAPPSAHCPGLPPELDALVMKGLARDPALRYATAREMAVALEEQAGIASARQLGDWVVEIAGDRLERRAQRVKEIESISTVRPHLPTVDETPAAAAAPAKRELPSSAEDLRPAGVPRRSAAVIPILLAVAILCAIGLLLGLRRATGPTGTAAGTPGSAPIESATARDGPGGLRSAPGPSEAPPQALNTITSAPLDATAQPQSSTGAAGATASAKPTSRPRAGASAGGQPSAAPAPKSCDPPYIVTESGVRKLKPECL